MALQYFIEVLFYAGVVNSHYSCLTWEVNGKNLSLICRTQNQIEPVSFFDSKGNLKARCTLNNQIQCKTFQINANTTANTYKNEVVFMINDYERKQIINDEWTCSQGNSTLKTVVSASKGILSDTDLTLSLLHSSSLQSVTLICVSCRAPHGNHAEFLIDDKSVDSIRYNMVTGKCTHMNGKCLPDKCSCIPSGNEFTRMFPFIAINKTTNFSCRMKFVDNDKSSIFTVISRVSYNGQEFIYNGTEAIISKPPINDEKRNVSDNRNNNRTDSNHDVPDAGQILYWVVIGVAVIMPCIVAIIVKLCCRSYKNTKKENDANEQTSALLHRTGETELSGRQKGAQCEVKRYFLENPYDVECYEGEDALFKCRVCSDSPPLIFLKDGKDINGTKNFGMSREGEEHSIRLLRTSASDNGEYEVQIGKSSRKVQLKVKVYFLEDPYDVECYEGDDALFECRVCSDSPPLIFLKDGKDITGNKNYKMTRKGEQYKIKLMQTSTSDNGEYVVQIGKSSRKVQLKIKGREEYKRRKEYKQYMQMTIEVWEKMDEFYFETSMSSLVMDALESKNCVTLIGASGEGKTISAKHAALQYRHKLPSFEVLEIFNPNELINAISIDKHQFFLVNDPLGKQCLNKSSLGEWVQMSKRLRDFLTGGHIKIVATIRKPLFKNNENRIKETVFGEYVIDYSSEKNRLSKEDKNGILAKNMKRTGKQLDWNIIKIMTTDSYHPGFPLFCHVISSNPNCSRYDTVDPCSVLIDDLKEFLDFERFHYCCIVLAFMHENVFDINDLAACQNINFLEANITDKKKILSIINSCNISTGDTDCFKSLKSGFDALSGTYFINKHPVYIILHDSITSAVAHTYGMDNIEMILEYGGSSIIREYVRTKQSEKNDDKIMIEIIVSSKFHGMLAKRFIRDIEFGDSANVFLHPSFLDEEFQSNFHEELMAMDKSKMLEMMAIAFNKQSPQHKDIRKYTKFALDVAILSASPIHWLCRLGLCKTLKDVLSKTEDKLKFLNELKVHTTPLHFAAGYGKIDVVKYLISIGVDINVKSQLQMLENPKIGQYFSGFPPLLYAARQNHPDVVEYMLQHGANPNLVRDHGGSPMLLAADRGHTEVIKQLLKYNGDPNLCCDHGHTPIILAAQGGYVESVMALIEGKADLNWQTFEKEGKTSALLAAAKNGYLKCAEVLVNYGANIELSDVNGSSPLLLAIQNKHLNTARALFKLGANINATNNSGESPSQLAKLSELDFIPKMHDMKI